MASGPARQATPVRAAARWFCLICLMLFLILFAIAQAGVVTTPRGTGLHGTMVEVCWLSIFGALAFLGLFECARNQFANRQLGWAATPLLSMGLLASAPSLWLALVRRRARDWVVFAVYLAATVTVIAALSTVPSDTSITGLPAAIWALLLVIAPVHAVLAFSREAKVPTWREAYPPAPGKRQQPLNDPETTGTCLDNSTRQPLTGWMLWWTLLIRKGDDMLGYYRDSAFPACPACGSPNVMLTASGEGHSYLCLERDCKSRGSCEVEGSNGVGQRKAKVRTTAFFVACGVIVLVLILTGNAGTF